METVKKNFLIHELQTDTFHAKWNAMIKRAFDILVSVLGLIFLSPLYFFVAFIIKRDSKGPVFYRGSRLGRGGRQFGILKFRTMRENAGSYNGPRVTAKDDSRITPLGKWLRDTKINELPQLWNVFVGEMSFVGPRPEDPEIAKTWPEDVLNEVVSVRPGITSPASVLYRDEEKMLSASRLMDTYLGDIMPSKLRLDQLYVRHHSFLVDLDVLFWTFLVVVMPSLRDHKPPEDTLFWGPISRLAKRYINWFFIDAFITFIAFSVVGVFERLFVAPLDLGFFPAVMIALLYSVLFSALGALMGVQKIYWSSAAISDAIDLVPPVVISYLVAMTSNSWLHFLPYHLIFDATMLAFAGYVFARYRRRILNIISSRWMTLRRDALLVGERVLIVGAGDTGQFVAWRLKHNHESSNYQVLGFVDDDIFRQGVRLNGLTILGKHEDIPQLVEKHDIGVIIFAIHNISPIERASILKVSRSTNARVVVWPDAVSLIQTHSPETSDAGVAHVKTQPLQKLTMSQVKHWLNVLEVDLNHGDFKQVMEDVKSMRSALQDENFEGAEEA